MPQITRPWPEVVSTAIEETDVCYSLDPGGSLKHECKQANRQRNIAPTLGHGVIYFEKNSIHVKCP